MTSTFMITIWTVIGLMVVGPVTVRDVSCQETFDFYQMKIMEYGGGSMDFLCSEDANVAREASEYLPDPVDLLPTED